MSGPIKQVRSPATRCDLDAQDSVQNLLKEGPCALVPWRAEQLCRRAPFDDLALIREHDSIGHLTREVHHDALASSHLKIDVAQRLRKASFAGNRATLAITPLIVLCADIGCLCL